MLGWLKDHDASSVKLCKNMQIWPLHVIKGMGIDFWSSSHVQFFGFNSKVCGVWPMFGLLWPECLLVQYWNYRRSVWLSTQKNILKKIKKTWLINLKTSLFKCTIYVFF
jgi:hypothetical protein